MRIATITCHSAYNYGAVLQTYALMKYLQTSENYAEVLDYRPPYVSYKEFSLKNIVKKIIMHKYIKKQKSVFGKFLNNHINLSTKSFTSCEDLKSNVNKYDLYITGSDQVWNMNMKNGNDDSYFLAFVPENSKKISYAASLAMDCLTFEQSERIKSLLCDYSGISVRETTGVQLLNNLNIPCINVCDPVYLLNKQDWDSISSNKIYDDKYVLVYCFYNQPNVYEEAVRYAKRNNCKVYVISTNYKKKYKYTDKYFYVPQVEEFVNLFSKAEAVFTNSFHGLSFSLIYNKPVYSFKTTKKGNSRILDMLKISGIDVSSNEPFFSITMEQYETINKNITELIIRSKNFLEVYTQ